MCNVHLNKMLLHRDARSTEELNVNDVLIHIQVLDIILKDLTCPYVYISLYIERESDRERCGDALALVVSVSSGVAAEQRGGAVFPSPAVL